MKTQYSSFLVLFLLGVALRLSFVVLLPYGQEVKYGLEGLNDEPAHHNYVKYLASHRSFPVQTMSVRDPGAFEKAVFEYYQPPLYYVLCSIPTAILGETAGLYAGRFIAFLFGIGTVLFIGRILRRAGAPKEVEAGGILFSCFFLTHVYFCSLVSNDSLSWFLASMITHQLVCYGQTDNSHARWKHTTAATAFLALGLLTKTSLLVFCPLVVLVYLWVLIKTDRNKSVLVQGVVCVLCSLAIASPWYLRNLRLYGSVFALEVGFGPPQPWIDSLYDVLALLYGTVGTFWFPMQHLQRSIPTRLLQVSGIVLGLVHAVAAVWFLLQSRRSLGLARFTLVALLVFVLGAYFRLNVLWWESEGRFLLTGMASIVFLLALSTWELGGKLGWKRWFVTYLVVLAGYPYLYLVFSC